MHAPSLAQCMSGCKVYFRFNVSKGLEDIGLEEYKEKARIVAATRMYLNKYETSNDVKECAKAMKAAIRR
jgi:hypothetical protein